MARQWLERVAAVQGVNYELLTRGGLLHCTLHCGLPALCHARIEDRCGIGIDDFAAFRFSLFLL
jgi:hypothetical protein